MWTKEKEKTEKKKEEEDEEERRVRQRGPRGEKGRVGRERRREKRWGKIKESGLNDGFWLFKGYKFIEMKKVKKNCVHEIIDPKFGWINQII